MKSIFLLTNFSEAANHAIRKFMEAFAPALSKNYKLVLINAWKQPRTGHFQMINLDDYLHEVSMYDLNQEAKFIIHELGWPEKKIKIISKKGDVVEVVKQLAQEAPPDLMVAGTKGTNLLREIIAGSTTGRLLRQIKLPTLLIPETVSAIYSNRMVFASDLKECSNKNDFEKLTQLAKNLMAEFLILHVYKKEKPNVDKFEKCMEPYLAGINYAFHYEQHVSVEAGIVDFVSNMKAGLLALIGRKDELLVQLLKNSVTQGIVQRACVPMLIIHE